jgi:hypothetical protein
MFSLARDDQAGEPRLRRIAAATRLLGDEPRTSANPLVASSQIYFREAAIFYLRDVVVASICPRTDFARVAVNN